MKNKMHNLIHLQFKIQSMPYNTTTVITNTVLLNYN
jgi:hypothetical protein